MKITVRKTFQFHAAHCIPYHEGHCSRPHGHTYTVTVEATGERALSGPTKGMVIDFGSLKSLYESRVHDVCDHRDLNEVFDFDTTAENLAAHFLDQFRIFERSVVAVEVSEGPSNMARAEVHQTSPGVWQ